MTKEELTKLLIESYDRGVEDAKQEALAALEKTVAVMVAAQPAQQEPVVWRPSESDYEQWCDRHDTQLDRDAFEDAASLYMEYAHNIKEPVAWVCEGSEPDEKHGIDYWPGDVDDLPIGTQLYTSPPPQRTWVGLTDEEVWDLWNSYTEEPFPEWFVDFKRSYKVLEAKLRELNT